MSALGGAPSDEVPRILATGDSGVTRLFLSMTRRHPDGRDAEYLRWHTLDHRPEQFRLPGMRNASRIVSTPACRAARAASDPRYDAVDHIAVYFFADDGGMATGRTLTKALIDVGRIPEMLPTVEQAVYRFGGMAVAPRIKIGADVLPWWPVRGIYVLIERGTAAPSDLVEVPGVGGVWWAAVDELQVDLELSKTDEQLQLTYCFLDDDPVAVAERLRDTLEQRWSNDPVTPLFAAPFHPVEGYAYDRYLP